MYSFYIDKQEEIAILNKMLSDGGGCTVTERAEQYHIPLDIANKCTKNKIPQELTHYVDQVYKEKEQDLQKALSFHNDFEYKKASDYQAKLSKLMAQDIPEFRVRLQALCDGISDWGGTNIAIYAFDYLTGHPAWDSCLIWETILALTFHQVRQKYDKTVYPDETVWAVSEMTSCAIINIDFKVQWDIGYRQLFPHQKEVFKLYQNRKNFPDFIEQMLAYFADKNISL